MRIELGGPVVAERRGEDEIVWERLHLPAEAKTWRGGYGDARRRALHGYAWPPLNWPALCGLKGYLYAYGGVIRSGEIPFCSVCLERCNADLRGVAVSWDAPARFRVAA